MATAQATTRTIKKEEARSRILDTFISLLIEGAEDLSHDAVAERADVGRRTVYRYFPDRPALMDAALLRVRERAGVRVTYPQSAEELLDTLEAIYPGFDSIAPLITMLRTTPQGRQLRLAQNRRARARSPHIRIGRHAAKLNPFVANQSRDSDKPSLRIEGSEMRRIRKLISRKDRSLRRQAGPQHTPAQGIERRHIRRRQSTLGI